MVGLPSSENSVANSEMPPNAPKVVMALMICEVALQCRFAVYAYEELRKIIGALDEENARFREQFLENLEAIIEDENDLSAQPPSGDQEDVAERTAHKHSLRARAFFYVHALLTHAANISKICWPDVRGQRQKYEARGNALRDLIGLDDTSALAERDLRNALEHYDERVENWASTVHGPISITDLTIGSPYWYAEWFEEEVKNMHRTLDVEAAVLSFLGVEQNLLNLMREIARIQRVVDSWLVKHVPGYQI